MPVPAAILSLNVAMRFALTLVKEPLSAGDRLVIVGAVVSGGVDETQFESCTLIEISVALTDKLSSSHVASVVSP